MATDHFLDRQFYFDGLENRQLLLQKCDDCGHIRFPAIPICNRCKSRKWEAIASTGNGRIFSYIAMRRPQLPDLVSPLAATVDLDEGVRIVTSIIGVEADELAFDMAVKMEFVVTPSGRNIHAFRPVSA